MKKYLFIFAGILLLLVVVYFLQSYIRSNFSMFESVTNVEVADRTLRLEIADDAHEREIGLSEKRSLNDDQGMVFVFDKPDFYSFWMRDMDFPIDIIYLRDNKIVTIFENVPAPTDNTQNLKIYTPKSEADRVVELKAGASKELGLKEGDSMNIEI